MALELVHEYSTVVRDGGATYVARAYADQQVSGLWEGWLVFFPLGEGQALATDRETTQSKRADVSYWATGLSPAYLEGALRRALDRRPEVQLARVIARADAAAAYASAEAAAYEAAAEEARAVARRATASRRDAEARLDGH